MALFDEIKQKLNQGPTATPVPSYQQLAEKVLAAKTGKAQVAGATPAASRLGEQAAVAAVPKPDSQLAVAGLEAEADATRGATALERIRQQRQQAEGLAQLKQQQDLGGLRRGAQEAEAFSRLGAERKMQIAQQNSEYDKIVKNLASEKKIQVDGLFRSFRRENKTLDARRDAAQLEQTAHVLAMRNKDYLAALEDASLNEQVQDEANFAKTMARVRADGNRDIANMQSEWYIKYKGDANAFAKDVAKIDLNSAWEAYKTLAKAESESALVKGVATGATSVANYKATHKEEDDKNKKQDKKVEG